MLSKLSEFEQSDVLLDELMPVYDSHNRNNLYNEITRFANLIGNGDSPEKCDSALLQLTQIEPHLKKESAEGWRRLGAEVWISQLLKRCHNKDLAMQWLMAAVDKSVDVYQSDSEGLQYIHKLLADWQASQ